LCEKPLAPLIQDAAELKNAQEKYNRKLGVGFQLSYSKPVLDFKADIINGEFGKPLEFKSFTSWRRYDAYYNESDWKGRVRGKDGEWILDSVSTNATAHYLFNIFFTAGDKLGTSATPKEAQAEIYRAKDIASYDTCYIRGSFDNGCKFYYFATHSGERDLNPSFEYKFENATVKMNRDKTWNYEIIAEFNDGREKNYGNAMSDGNEALKLSAMMAAARGDFSRLTCDIDTVMPHIIISNAIFDQAEFIDFPKDICCRDKNPAGTFVNNLVEDSIKCYETMRLPSELKYSWAATAPTELNLADYNKFSGAKFK
jgi:predicted dehydrogenase